MKLLKEATWSCLGKNAAQPSLTIGSSRNLVWSFIEHLSMIWSLRSLRRLLECHNASVSESISHLCILSLVVQVALEKRHFFSFFLPKTFPTFQDLSPSPTTTSSHHKPPLFSVETPHRKGPFNRSGIFQLALRLR